jgi:hypothetical protein
LVVAGLALAGVLACIVGRGTTDAHRVYTVAQVQAGLARDPKVWVNRTVLVRGRIMQGYWMRGRVGVTWGLAEYCAATPSGCPFDSPPGGLIPRGTVVHLGLRSDGLDSENRYLPMLTLVPQPAGAWVLFLRRIPLVASIVPTPQHIQWGTLATYQIYILPKVRRKILPKVRRNACTPICDDAVLLNVAF